MALRASAAAHRIVGIVGTRHGPVLERHHRDKVGDAHEDGQDDAPEERDELGAPLRDPLDVRLLPTNRLLIRKLVSA